MASSQRAITSGATAVVQMLEALLTSGKSSGSMDKQSLVTKGCDSLAMLGYASQELSQKRREAMRPALKKEYAGLMSRSIPVTSKWFEDEAKLLYGINRFKRCLLFSANPCTGPEIFKVSVE